jgi:hypothetical protein
MAISRLTKITECLRCHSEEISYSDGDMSFCRHCFDFYSANDLLVKVRAAYQDECVRLA